MSDPSSSVARQMGRYQLRTQLASGGMATVFLARATGAGEFAKVVAIKTINQALSNEPEALRMFIDEARIASAISHPNVCQVFDFGQEGGTYYLVMEYLVGEPLSRVIRRLVSENDPEARKKQCLISARIIADAAEGLHAAHELKGPDGKPLDVVHRDISPQNIFITYDGVAKVVDFGIAKARQRLQHTAPGTFKGKYAYVAPEQLTTTPVDRRVDVWALGVCLWELLSGRKLFARKDIGATVEAIARGPIPPVSQVAPWVDPKLEKIVSICLQRDAKRRFGTARDLGRALREYLAESGETVDPPEVGEWMGKLFPGEMKQKLAALEEASKPPTDPGAPPKVAAARNSSPGSDSGIGLVVVDDVDPSPEPPVRQTGVGRPQPARTWPKVLVFLLAMGAGAVLIPRLMKKPPPVESPVLTVTPTPMPVPTTPAPPDAAVVVAPMPVPSETLDASVDAVAVQPAQVDAGAGADAGAVVVAAAVDAGAEVVRAPSAVVDAGVATRPVEPKRPPRPPPPPVERPVTPPPPARPEYVPGGTGSVIIHSKGAVFDVTVDGQPRGKTPLKLNLSVGVHELEFREPGMREPMTRSLKVQLASEYSIELE